MSDGYDLDGDVIPKGKNHISSAADAEESSSDYSSYSSKSDMYGSQQAQGLSQTGSVVD